MKRFALLPLLCLCLAAVTMVWADGIQADLSGNLLRLHIIANSNSERDQSIKLAVRDSILKESRADTPAGDLAAAAEAELVRLGAEYGASAAVERCYVPKKEYKNLRLPEGFYSCIRVVLGEGKGENWWCVAYPPLCYSEEMFGGLSAEGEAQLAAALKDGSFKTIVKNGDISVRFWLVEEIKRLERAMSFRAQ